MLRNSRVLPLLQINARLLQPPAGAYLHHRRPQPRHLARFHDSRPRQRSLYWQEGSDGSIPHLHLYPQWQEPQHLQLGFRPRRKNRHRTLLRSHQYHRNVQSTDHHRCQRNLTLVHSPVPESQRTLKMWCLYSDTRVAIIMLLTWLTTSSLFIWAIQSSTNIEAWGLQSVESRSWSRSNGEYH